MSKIDQILQACDDAGKTWGVTKIPAGVRMDRLDKLLHVERAGGRYSSPRKERRSQARVRQRLDEAMIDADTDDDFAAG